MPIYCDGTATIAHGMTGVEYKIEARELTWSDADVEERDMGAETEHLGEIEHPELGYLCWSLWEYPEGAENMRETDVGEHKLVKNFDFGLNDSGPYG